MSELSSKLSRLTDLDRVRLYRDLLDRRGETSPRSVRELVLVYQNDAAVSLNELREVVASRLPTHERPTRFVATDKLPRTRHGKIDRRGIPGLVRTEYNELAAPDAGDDINLTAAVEAFRHVLGTVAVGPDTNFFELGGHSLLVVEFILKFGEATGTRINITQFLNHPTPRGVALLVSQESQHSLQYIYPVSDRQIGLPIFVFSANRLAYSLKSYRTDWAIYGIQMPWHNDDDKETHYRDLEAFASCIAAEIKQVCSGDDVILAGSSLPGVVAFEVARQLSASGKSPRLTFLIEPTFFYGVRTLIEVDLAEHGKLREGDNHILAWLVLNNPLGSTFWRRVYRYAESFRAKVLSGRTASQTLTHKQVKKKEVVTNDATKLSHLESLWRKYRPHKYSGPIVLVTGEQGWRYRREWRKLFSDERAVHNLDARHMELLREPFISTKVMPVLSAEIESAMDRETD